MEKKELVAFAMDFASYAEERLEGIRRIILFGSVARGTSDSESDVDIFVDMPRGGKNAADRMSKIKDSFEKTERFRKWKLKGVDNEINVLAGDLDGREWESLRASIISSGITLFGKYESSPGGLKGYTIFAHDPVKDEKRRVNLHRKLFGYSLNGKKYPGFVSRGDSLKLGPRVFMVPLKDAEAARSVLKEMGMGFRVFEVWKE